MLENRIVRIKPLPIDKWHGKKGKDSFSRPRVIEALFDPKTGRYATGLTKQEMEELSKILGTDINDIYYPDRPHPLWGENKAFKLVLPNHTIFLNLSNPMEYIKYKLALASRFVANSYKDWVEGKYPDATHYIDDERIATELEYEKVKTKQEAYKILSKLNMASKKNLVTILYGIDTTNSSDELIEVKLGAAIEDNAQRFIEYAQMDKHDIGLMAMLIQAENKAVVRKINNSYYFGDMRLGIDLNEAVEFLKNPENQTILVRIKEGVS